MFELSDSYKLELDPNSSFEVSKLEPTIKYVGFGGESWWSQTVLLEGLTKIEIGTDETVTWLGKDKHTKFYKTGNLIEAATVLEKKPTKGVLGYKPNQIVTPTTLHNLVAHYQPPLTTKEIEMGNERPEDIVGSHVFRHPTKGGMVTLTDIAKGITTGKFGNRYRPKIVDDQGNWVWADRQMINGLTIITIPIDFWEGARFPLRHAAGDTFGKTAASGSFIAAPSRIYANIYTGAAGTGTSMSVYGKEKNGKGEFKGALYLDSDDSKVDETDLGDMAAAAAWVQVNFSGSPSLTAVDYYVGCYIGNEGGTGDGIQLGYDTASLPAYAQYSLTPFTYPDPIVPVSVGANYEFGVFVTYTPSGGTDHTKVLSDTVTIADSIVKSPGLFKAELTLAITDVISKEPGLIKSESALAITDVIVKGVGLGKADTVTIGDSLAKAVSKILADNVTIADTISKGVAKVLADTITITDTTFRVLGRMIKAYVITAQKRIANLITGE